MKVIHVLRKPCSESTVAANVLRYGAGALNIDATRIHAPDASAGRVRHGGGVPGGGSSYELPDYREPMPAGRWPANLVLQHLDGCVQDSTETVAAWTCAPGCPVAALDEQSGDLSSQVTRRNPDNASRDTGMFGISRKQKNGPEYLGQTGGASRFFKQVKP